jgi:DNA-binding phage protein
MLAKVYNIKHYRRSKQTSSASTFGYLTYNFVDKDPEIDRLRTEIQRQRISYKEVADRSGVSLATLLKWFNKDTKQPRHSSIMAVWAALGYNLVPKRIR